MMYEEEAYVNHTYRTANYVTNYGFTHLVYPTVYRYLPRSTVDGIGPP